MRSLICLLLLLPSISMAEMPRWEIPPMAHRHLLSSESIKNFNIFLQKYKSSHRANVMMSAPAVHIQKGSTTTPDIMVGIRPDSAELDVLTIDPKGKLEIRAFKPNFPGGYPPYGTQIIFGNTTDHGSLGFSLKYPLENLGFTTTYEASEEFFEVRKDGRLAVKASIAEFQHATVRADTVGADLRSIKLSSALRSLETPATITAVPDYGKAGDYSGMDCTILGSSMGQSAGAVIQIYGEVSANSFYYIQCKDRRTGKVAVTFKTGTMTEFDGLMSTTDYFQMYQNDRFFEGIVTATLLRDSMQHEKLETSKIYNIASDIQGSIQHVQVDPVGKQLLVTMSTGKVYQGKIRINNAVAAGGAELLPLSEVGARKSGFFGSLCAGLLGQ